MERYHIFKLGLAILFYAAYCIRPMMVTGQEVEDNETKTQKFDESDLVFYQGVEGKPGVDFPVLSHIPRTSFNCRDVGSGYYADLETDCQVFHICEDNKKISFLCPNGTIFEQSELICEWWFKVNCTNSPNLYEESAEQLREEAAKRKLSRKVNNHGAVMRTEERSSVSARQNGRNFDAGGRASKRVPLNDDNRLNNHAPTYRDNIEEVQSNDLSRSSTSDFVRNRNGNGQFATQNQNVDSGRKQKKPVQFQAPASTDNDSNVRKENVQRNQNGRNNRNKVGTRRRLEPSDSRNQNSVTNTRNQESSVTSGFGFEKDANVQVNGQQNFFPTEATKSRNSQTPNMFSDRTKGNNFNRGQTKFSNRQSSNQDSNNDDYDDQFDSSRNTNRNNGRFSNTQNSFDISRNKNRIGGTTEQKNNQESFSNHRGAQQGQTNANRESFSSSQGSPNAFNNFQNKNSFGTIQQEKNQQTSSRHPESFSNHRGAPQNDNDDDERGQINANRESFSNNQGPAQTQNVFDNFGNKNRPFGSTQQEQNSEDDQQTSSRHREGSSSNRGSSRTEDSFNNFRNNEQTSENTHFNNNRNNDRLEETNTNNRGSPQTQSAFDNPRSRNQDQNDQQTSSRHQESSSNNPGAPQKEDSANNFRNQDLSRTNANSRGSPQTQNAFDNSRNRNQQQNNQQTSSRHQESSSNNRGAPQKEDSFNNFRNQDLSRTNDNSRGSPQTQNAFDNSRNRNQNRNDQQTSSRHQESSPNHPRPFSSFKNNDATDKSSQANANQESFSNRQTEPQIKNNFRSQNQNQQQQNSFTDQYIISQTNANNRESISIRNSNHQSSSHNSNQFINDFSDSTSPPVSTQKHPQSFSFGTRGPTSTPSHQNNFNGNPPCQGTSDNQHENTKDTHFNDNEEPQRPIALSTITQPNNNKNLQVGTKTTTLNQKSTVPLTRNDIVNRRLEHTDSEEAQITQETASFYKNSRNKIDQSYKPTSPNPHPNHRETYSELKEPKYFTTKTFTSISSVTPQYLTTQPINNGRPFIGSQVGTTLGNFRTTTKNYFSTTSVPSTTNNLFNVGKTDGTLPPISSTEAPSTLSVPTERFNTGRTDKTIRPVPLSTFSTPRGPANVTLPPLGSFNLGTSTPTVSSTRKIIDHATVYGKFVKSSSTPQPSKNTKILLSKSLFGGATPTPFSKPSKGSSEILSTSDSYNRGDSQVRFFGKVQSSKSIPGVELSFNGNSFSTTARPFSLSTTRERFSTSTIDPEYNSVTPLSISTFNPEFNSVTPTYFSTTDTPTSFSTTSDPEFNSISTTIHPEFDSFTTTQKPFNTLSPKPKVSGFFVTRNNNDAGTTEKSRISKIIRPRPFELPPLEDFRGKAIYTTTEDTPTTPTPTYPTYKISSASPFAEPSTPEPTQPTPFTTALPTTFENVDSMINALAEMATQNFSDNPRPGLIIPPSAGPQTLHTLAVYFANALDGIAADKEEENVEEEDESNLTRVELEKKRLTELLTQMTMDRYNELFNEEHDEHEEKEEEVTTVASRSGVDDDDNDLEGQHSKGLAQEPPKVRQLAKVFTQALSSYLDDPANFKKVLEEIRPTEPPSFDNDDGSEDELLNFSDADSKSSYPPFFPTIPSAHPTWGFLLAYNTSQNLDVKNSINPDENLQGADSQSFVSQFNKLQTTNKPSTQLPEDHWTSSPDAHKLFRSAFAFDPASINENFGTTEISVTTEEGTEEPETVEEAHHEIQYELKALPNLELNSTQVHGILIDFMNTTKMHEGNRLERILRKLNTTEDEFLTKMKEIENNPLTRRLILLLINECGSNATAQAEAQVLPLHSLLPSENNTEVLQTAASSNAGFGERILKHQGSPSGFQIADPSLDNDNQDARALQLLNSLYSIASKFGK